MSKNNKTSVQANEEASKNCRRMTPNVMDALYDIAMDESCNAVARVQAIAIILERGLGRPEECIRIQNEREEQAASQARLDAIAKRIQKEIKEEKRGYEKG